MNDCEYVDVLSDRYTKIWKTIAWVRFGLKMFVKIVMLIGLVLVGLGLEPYIKGDEVWEDMPFTLSQINALLVFFVWVWMIQKSYKVM